VTFHFVCRALNPESGTRDLQFSFDPESGAVSGASASEIVRWLSAGSVSLHPVPNVHYFSGERPTMGDIAAIVGLRHQLPAELAGAYPQPSDDGEIDTGADGPVLQPIW